ncbi:uncharacterized protein EV420DRAFT_1647012 [Desarmillaria tabescens]|uniref:Uncharacterized protein n=1 Tax=Armillaria tabescens TaxID=1929756 RepID=A0AA39JVG7_ARMTA|nr:uncharacterized protein EV420DRAFT_1647012 [Desarmillaria tabescens]KAK0449677.1 hypothetical protein EV420DRAFT_1647012 [Desarmillaria tabescens]
MDLQGMAPNTPVPFDAPKLESFKYRVDLCDEEEEEWEMGDGISLEYFFNIICSSPKLAVVDIVCKYSLYETVSPCIVKPLLSNLVVNNTAFLRSLLVPSLKEATLIADFDRENSGQPGSPPQDFLTDFYDLLVESRCTTLSRLDISVNLLHQHLFSILELSPALVSFQLRFETAWNAQYDVLMRELIVQLMDVEAFLPLLEEIELEVSIHQSVSDRLNKQDQTTKHDSHFGQALCVVRRFALRELSLS